MAANAQRLGSTLLVAALAATLAQGASAQRGPAPAGRGVILGAVTDTGLRAVAGVNVEVIGTTARLTTGDDGLFRVQDVAPGEYLVWIRRLGFRPVSNVVRIEPGDTLRLSYMLEPTLTELNTVTVTERLRSITMREFDERRRAGFGHFLTQEQIEKLGFGDISNVIRTFTAVRVEPKSTMEGYGNKAMSARQERCPMRIQVDGIPRGNDLNDLPSPKEIAGIEVYAGPATVPIQFGRGSCGLILIWTRRD